MVETSKQVRVDNWGIYFLQRLQLFFSKTDYCDLTLQFEGNVQLKVHRLVMNACTEYFTFLEQTCSAMEENTILMPSNLQADVIVPIVNFMYTGMLEFHPSIFDKLFAAAETMNIAVLTKLLEAQMAPMSSKTTTRGKRDREYSAGLWKKPAKANTSVVEELSVPTYSKKPTPWKRRINSNAVQSHPASATFTSKWASGPSDRDPLSFHDNTPKPTRFEWPEDEIAPMSMYPSFDDVSLTSKPLWTKDDDHKAAPVEEPSRQASSSPVRGIDEPPATQDQKVTPLDNVTQNQNDISNKRKAEGKVPVSPKRVKISSTEEETVITITTSNPSEVDHTKFVSDILKKYPDLVKKKRNIKLKIIQAKPDNQPVKNSKENAVVKLSTQSSNVEPKASSSSVKETPSTSKEISTRKTNFINSVANKKKPVNPLFKSVGEEGPWTCLECANQERDGAEFVLYYLFRKHMASQHQVEFDSSLCKYCGKKCSKESAMVYHLYIKHGLKPPKEVVYPKCNKCPFIAVTVNRLQQHMNTHGKDEVQCPHCYLGFFTKRDFQTHQRFASHNNRKSSILECAYCKKKLQSPVTLFTHVRSQHMKEAKRDGVTSLNEVLDVENEDDFTEPERKKTPEPENITEDNVDAAVEQSKKKNKVKILSNVQVSSQEENRLLENSIDKVPETTPLPDTEPTPVAVSAATTLSNIGGSLATNLGLVDIVVLDDNQQYILQQPQGQTGNAEFILPPELTGGEGILQAAAATGELNSTDELVMVLTDHDYQDEQNQGQSDNSNIVVLYSHPVEGQQGQFITSQGNLLVNSEGMLEIRNGTAITTTAGQILVNTDSTTTTQAIDSPVESIDLIRREIESSVGNETKTESLKPTDESVEPDKSEDLNEVVQESTEDQRNEAEGNLEEQQSEVVDAPADTSVPEESMEVDEDVLQEKQDITTVLEQNVDELHEGASQQENIEQTEENALEENEGQDIPPETNMSLAVPQEIDSGELNTTIIMNDPNHFEETSELTNPEEEMEVDSSAADQSYDEVATGVDEVDEEQFPSSEVVADVEEPHEETQPEAVETITPEDNEEKEAPTISNGTENQELVKDKEGEDRGDSNLQTHFEDFTTDDSQQSSSQKLQQTELNKEILDDWNDTDSQQSQGHEHENHEDGESAVNPASNQAAENVNKLMDDWDEEEEDQNKE